MVGISLIGDFDRVGLELKNANRRCCCRIYLCLCLCLEDWTLIWNSNWGDCELCLRYRDGGVEEVVHLLPVVCDISRKSWSLRRKYLAGRRLYVHWSESVRDDEDRKMCWLVWETFQLIK